MPMRVKLYLDVFFLINTGMNLVVFLTQSLLMQKTIRLWRLILASVLGAVMACLLVLFHVHRNLLLLVLSYFFVSVFLVRRAFGKMTTARTVMHLLLYYACAFILAGLLLQVQKSFHYPLTGASMLGLMLFVLFLFRYFMPKLKKEKERVSYLYRLRIYDRGNKIEGMALLDTGNGLYDAISKKPVMLGSKKFLEKLWKGKDPPLMRMIPYHSVGKKMGMLCAFRAQRLEIECGGDWQFVEDAWVAVCEECVSVDGEYEMILHPDMLNNEKGKEKS